MKIYDDNAFEVSVVTAAIFAIAAPAAGQVAISEVERFYRVYDTANGKPTAEALQRDYLDAGSQGLRDFYTEPHEVGR